MRRGLTTAALLVALAGPAAAGEVIVGADVRRDRFSYRFDNPSSFDTAVPVPHVFEQRYTADNLWATLTARYRARVRWETTFGATPARTATADDYDTFFQPDGAVIVSGTTGDASMRSFSVGQRAWIGRLAGVDLVAGYRFRFDKAGFGVGHKTVTRDGALVEATDVTSPETTRSEVHELRLGAMRDVTLGDRWRLELDGEVTPAAVARLVVQLPEKYPGRDLAFTATAVGGSARVTIERRGAWPMRIAVSAAGARSYRAASRYARSTIGVGLEIGRRW